MKLEVDGRVFELKPEGPYCLALFVDGDRASNMYSLHFADKGKKPKVGPPSVAQREAYLRNAAQYMKSHLGVVA